MLAAALFLAAVPSVAASSAANVASLAAESFRVPAHDYRYVPVRIANWPATLICSVDVPGGAPLTLDLIDKRELIRFVRGESPAFLLKMPESRKFDFRQALPEKGEYEVVLIDDQGQPSDVRFEASVEFAREPDPARYVSPQRRLVIIAASLLVFIVTISWSALKLIEMMRRT